jgi:hypothetical protein
MDAAVIGPQVGTPTFGPTQRGAAKGAGISKDQQVQAVRVANVPLASFGAAIDRKKPATVTALAEWESKPAQSRRL